MFYRAWIIICVASGLSISASVLWIVASATEWWELTYYDYDKLSESLPSPSGTETYSITKDAQHGLVIIVKIQENVNTTEYLCEDHSGIWQMCSYLSDQNRTFLNESGVTDWYASFPCFIYVRHFKVESIHSGMTDSSKWLVRMQNSATSCVIVVILLAFFSAVLAPFGVLKRQVAVCMVVAVMYGVAVVFAVFGICIIHAKVNFMNSESKYVIGPQPTPEAFAARHVEVSWSVYIAWAATILFFLCFCMWTWLFRTVCPDKSSYMTYN